MSWKPIETAPKDGTWILAVVAGFVPAVCRWDMHGRENGSFEHVEAETFAEESHWQDYIDSTYPWEPTHWHPLPTSPEPSND